MDDREHENRALQRRSYELAILNDVAHALNASVDLPTLLARALEKVTELLGLSTGWVLLFDEDFGEPYLAAAQNLPPGLREEPKLLTGWCYCLDSFLDGEMDGAVNVSVISCSRLRKLTQVEDKTAGLRFHASIPLEVQGGGPWKGREEGFGRLGMLNVAGPEWRELAPDELAFLRTIGDMLGVAIERARLHARRLEAAQAEERNRLAREIHDTIAQNLSAIAFQLEAAEALLSEPAQPVEPERARWSVTTALGLTRKALDEARRSVLDLRAAPLEGRTLQVALAALTAEVDAGNTPSVTFEVVPSIPFKLPSALEVGLYRIAQEALQNALRHAGATRVMLRLEVGLERIRLIVQDDGRGFAIEDANEGRFGLLGMRERARLLGGSFQVESAPGAGTRIIAEVPLGSKHHPRPARR